MIAEHKSRDGAYDVDKPASDVEGQFNKETSLHGSYTVADNGSTVSQPIGERKLTWCVIQWLSAVLAPALELTRSLTCVCRKQAAALLLTEYV